MDILTYTQVEGVVLSTLPFRDYDRIVTLFTFQEGILKLFVKGTKRSLIELIPLTTPFTAAEYLYTPRHSNLGRFHEGKLLQQHLALRDRFSSLEAAEQLSQALLASQIPGKPAPALYKLFRLILEQLSSIPVPYGLVAAFYLKILKHEGLFQAQPSCSICSTPLQNSFRYQGECFCLQDAPREALSLSAEEETLLLTLAHTRSLATLMTISLPIAFLEKIKTLFHQALNT